ncbi:hypothetical protein [Parvibaculum sp.]|uniref:hypothetical protein n=1 Tax=Parvibaculum sp. TaxID=2024848 RepID=UPI00391D146C
MSTPRQDAERAKTAVKAIVDGRPFTDAAGIMVTAEHAIATLLIVLYGPPQRAAAMLNEALVPGIETRLSFLDTIMQNTRREEDRDAVEAGYMPLQDYIAKWGPDKEGGEA